jgi:hypothetical protein
MRTKSAPTALATPRVARGSTRTPTPKGSGYWLMTVLTMRV